MAGTSWDSVAFNFAHELFSYVFEKRNIAIHFPQFTLIRCTSPFNENIGKSVLYMWHITREHNNAIFEKTYPDIGRSSSSFIALLETVCTYTRGSNTFSDLLMMSSLILAGLSFLLERGHRHFFSLAPTIWVCLFSYFYKSRFFAEGGWAGFRAITVGAALEYEAIAQHFQEGYVFTIDEASTVLGLNPLDIIRYQFFPGALSAVSWSRQAYAGRITPLDLAEEQELGAVARIEEDLEESADRELMLQVLEEIGQRQLGDPSWDRPASQSLGQLPSEVGDNYLNTEKERLFLAGEKENVEKTTSEAFRETEEISVPCPLRSPFSAFEEVGGTRKKNSQIKKQQGIDRVKDAQASTSKQTDEDTAVPSKTKNAELDAEKPAEPESEDNIQDVCQGLEKLNVKSEFR